MRQWRTAERTNQLAFVGSELGVVRDRLLKNATGGALMKKRARRSKASPPDELLVEVRIGGRTP